MEKSDRLMMHVIFRHTGMLKGSCGSASGPGCRQFCQDSRTVPVVVILVISTSSWSDPS